MSKHSMCVCVIIGVFIKESGTGDKPLLCNNIPPLGINVIIPKSHWFLYQQANDLNVEQHTVLNLLWLYVLERRGVRAETE